MRMYLFQILGDAITFETGTVRTNFSNNNLEPKMLKLKWNKIWDLYYIE